MEVINIMLDIILVCIFGQLATISHEFGHAIPALVFTKDDVEITFGKDSKKTKKINLGRLKIKLGEIHPFLGFTNWNEDKLIKRQKVITSAGGPIISLIIGVCFIVSSSFINDTLLKELISFSAYYHLWQFICTAIPIIYPKWCFEYAGNSSDGYKIITSIKAT